MLIRLFISLLLGIYCLFSWHFAIAQEELLYISELREKYMWESIYLTYVPLTDMTQILRDDNNITILSLQENGDILPKLKTFLGGNTNDIVLLHIDLKNLKAGYIKGDEANGIVTQQSWSQQEVLKIAYWWDRFLNDNSQFVQLEKAIKDGSISLQDAWNGVEWSKENPLLPQRKISSLYMGFWHLLENKQEEFAELKDQNKLVYENIYTFSQKNDYQLVASNQTDMLLLASSQKEPNKIFDTSLTENPTAKALILFDYDSNTIRPESYPLLEKLANAIKAMPDGQFVIAGHMDSVGTDEYNLYLSTQRAQAVKDYLTNQFEINPQQLYVRGFGERYPIASNETAEGRSLNRRVEFIRLQ